jgi:hypothetical protein
MQTTAPHYTDISPQRARISGVLRYHIIGQPYPAFSLVRLLAKGAANASYAIFYKSCRVAYTRVLR